MDNSVIGNCLINSNKVESAQKKRRNLWVGNIINELLTLTIIKFYYAVIEIERF